MKNPFAFLFGGARKKLDDEYVELFNAAKEAALKRALGEPYDVVLHATIPFFVGGALDLYPFPCALGGTLFATQEVIAADPKGGPKKSSIGRYELVACMRERFEPRANKLPSAEPSPAAEQLISRMLNPIARYSSMAVLKPRETVEIPGDAEDGSDNLHVLLDEYPAAKAEFQILDEKCGLMLCIAIHRSECDFARANGRAKLIERLRSAGVYPFSDLEREAVV